MTYHYHAHRVKPYNAKRPLAGQTGLLAFGVAQSLALTLGATSSMRVGVSEPSGLVISLTLVSFHPACVFIQKIMAVVSPDFALLNRAPPIVALALAFARSSSSR